MKNYILSDMFAFDEQGVSFQLLYKMHLADMVRDAFNYVFERLPKHNVGPLEKMKWDEGKNYHWVAIQEDDVSLLIRRYQLHFTVYFKINSSRYNHKTGCFAVETVLDGMSDDMNNMYVEDNFIDMDALLKPLIKMIAKGNVYGIWNNHSLPRPKHVKITNGWNGGDDLSSINLFVFSCDELFGKYLELFAETEMLERIKWLKVGDMVSTFKITDVRTDLVDNYYHGVGITWQNTNFPNSEPHWQDVYSLTRYNLEYLFPEHKKEINE